MNVPRQYALVKPTAKFLMEHSRFFAGEHMVFLGEIPNMPHHCVVYRPNGNETLIGYHTSDFVELTEDEL